MTNPAIVRLSLTGIDGITIAAYEAWPDRPAKGMVQIAHGMSEHFGRYQRLAARLNDAGYAVYGADHRGHGGSAATLGIGRFGPGGFGALVDDMAILTRFAKQRRPDLPLVLLGHSMGSFASQLYLLDHHRELAGLALSATAALDKLLASLLAGGGPVSLELLNASFEPGRTPFDWLSRDWAEVDAYMADPLCGFPLEEAAMGSMFALGAGASSDPRLQDVRHDLPIYVISGGADPVVGPGQGFTRALLDRYRDAGLVNIEHNIYEGGRHEMFNEICREQVEAELVAWLDRVIAQ